MTMLACHWFQVLIQAWPEYLSWHEDGPSRLSGDTGGSADASEYPRERLE
jgi:hypothetical protein